MKLNELKILNSRTEKIHFTRVLDVNGNESESQCEINCTVHTVETPSFNRRGVVSAEFGTATRDVVVVHDRIFEVGKTSCGKKNWLSITLPPELDPRPKPREFAIYLSKMDKLITEDTPSTAHLKGYGWEQIRVREILEP